MLRPSLYLILFLFVQAASAEYQGVAAGLGLEARMQKEVNPDYVEGKTLGQVFAQVLFENWTLHMDFGQEKHVTNAGGITIGAKTYIVGLWGQYIFVNANRWQPFVSAGAGANFDTVTSRFGSATDERSGIRYFGGAGLGISAVYFKYLLVEGEGRIVGVQDRREPMVSALLRAGFYY